VQDEWGLMASVTAGYQWRIFYVGAFANLIDWYSEVAFEKYESSTPYHWYLAASANEECFMRGFGFGFSFGMRLTI
jgi:hypothetical protein